MRYRGPRIRPGMPVPAVAYGIPESHMLPAHIPAWTHVGPDEGVPGCNIFIRGLKSDATDSFLHELCSRFDTTFHIVPDDNCSFLFFIHRSHGEITSAKAIIDRESLLCKGFVACVRL